MSMWPEKKPQMSTPRNLSALSTLSTSAQSDQPASEPTSKLKALTAPGQERALLGASLVLKGEMSGSEDVRIDGQFEGTINLENHCLTVGPDSQVKAEIHAGRVIVHGSVNGNISVQEQIEIRKTGHVVGDLLGPGISIEDGAYLKGSVEILREQSTQAIGLAARSAGASGA